ncbi:hypothetical protein L798_04998 [Zootermopsis nevadensis]|uniref:Uncharacterized protein n=1 Tax=Zootermopsis nevadensis TaxID=136037 RepID=A0A067RCE8_ZOONE|nr:hypothetical protein L798_04998 [Zootermopsis nevadensis]
MPINFIQGLFCAWLPMPPVCHMVTTLTVLIHSRRETDHQRPRCLACRGHWPDELHRTLLPTKNNKRCQNSSFLPQKTGGDVYGKHQTPHSHDAQHSTSFRTVFDRLTTLYTH